MSIYNKIYIYISIFSCCFSFLTTSVKAADATRIDSLLKVSPVLLKIKLEPGSKQLQTITIENLTGVPMPIRANVEGFDPGDEQTGFSPSNSATISPLSLWITITEAETIIPSKSKKDFIVKISVPDTVPIGGYYAIIYFSPLYPGSSVTSKIGVIALANIGIQDTVTNHVSIRDFSFDTPLYEKNPLTAHIRVTNTSLNYFSAKPTLTIAPIWGKSDSVSLDEKIILPAKSRSWKSVFSIQNSKWGIYLATLTVSIENGVSVSKTIPVALLPIRLMFMVLVTLLLIYFFWKKRANIKKALRVLFSTTTSGEVNTHIQTNTSDSESQQVVVPLNELHDIHSDKIDPKLIVDTVARHNGSISEAAKELHIHRSTVHRWVQRANVSVTSKSGALLARKSTRPHSMRSSSLTNDMQRRIIQLKKDKHLTIEEIIQSLHLTVSARTIQRVLKSHNNTRNYSHKSASETGK